MNYQIYSLGESAITIDFGNEISHEKNSLVIDIANQIENNNFAGFIECVPAYSALTIFYDVFKVQLNQTTFNTAFEFVSNFVERALDNLPKTKESKRKTIEIPVSFEKEFALDLGFVAEYNNIEPTKVIQIFLSKTYQVFMLGFLPGFAYMGELDERIATPRKKKPRTKTPKGSIGIAGKQTGIYPLESPGGWQIIGKTDIELFTPEKDNQTLFQAGNLVKFIQK